MIQSFTHSLTISPVVLSGYRPASSTTKTGRHDIAEILLKAALSTINQIKSAISPFFVRSYTKIYHVFIYIYHVMFWGG